MDEDCFVTQVRKEYFKRHGFGMEKVQNSEENSIAVEQILNDLFVLAVKELSTRLGSLNHNTTMETATMGLNELVYHIGDITGGKTANRFVDFLEECLYNIIEELKARKQQEQRKKHGESLGYETLSKYLSYTF